MITRRQFLKLAGVAAVVPTVREVIPMRSAEDIQRIVERAVRDRTAISVSGGRHVMGGPAVWNRHTATRHARGNRVLNFDSGSGWSRLKRAFNGLSCCHRYCGRRFWLQLVPLLPTFFNAKHECENERLRRSSPGSDGGFIDGPFPWWYRRLCRFFALREANRHHLMYYSAATRTLLLRLGERLVEQGRLSSPEDAFYLTIEARADLLAGGSRDCKG